MGSPPENPFRYGRQLTPGELVDRGEELAQVRRAMLERGMLFLIGPRRFGKTSIANVAAAQAVAEGATVLRFDAEAFPTPQQLAERIVAEATKHLSGAAEKAHAWLSAMFRRLRPNAVFNAQDATWTVSFGVDTSSAQAIPNLVEALNGVDRAAQAQRKPVAVVIDELQALLIEGGRVAEGQLRAAVQTHEALGYVFAGSDTKYLERLTGNPSAAFFNQGTRVFVGPVPDGDMLEFLRQSFATGRFAVSEAAFSAILDLADRVPYNVQALASECWQRLCAAPAKVWEARDVANSARAVALRSDPLYTQLWTALSAAQKNALIAFVRERGRHLQSERVTNAHRLSPSGMQKALSALQAKHVLRSEGARGVVTLRMQDPFFALWIEEIAP